MFKDEEDKLNQWKKSIEQTEIPLSKLDQAINSGFDRARKEKSNRRRRIQKPSYLSIAAAAVLFLMLVISIRVSPAFAQAMASIPGMEKLVELVSDNKGLTAAIENDYYQPIGLTETKDGVSVTLDGVIGDSSAMVLFYTIDSYQSEDSWNIEDISVNGQREEVPAGSISSRPHGDQLNANIISTVHWQEENTTKDMILSLKITHKGKNITFDLPFTYKDLGVESKIFELNKTVEVEKQKITIDKVTINPVHTEILVKFDPDNTMEIFSFEDLRIVNESGETWTSIQNGVTASQTTDDEITFYLQSNYFDKAKNLSLQFNKIMALDKDQAELVIDTERKAILKQPEDNRYELIDIVESEDPGTNKNIVFKFRDEKEFNHFPFSEVKDVNGKEFSGFTSWQTTGGEYEDWGLELPDEPYKNPLTYKLTAHPNWIQGDVSIKLK